MRGVHFNRHARALFSFFWWGVRFFSSSFLPFICLVTTLFISICFFPLLMYTCMCVSPPPFQRPFGVTRIEDNAFFWCTGLTTVVLPSRGLTSIGSTCVCVCVCVCCVSVCLCVCVSVGLCVCRSYLHICVCARACIRACLRVRARFLMYFLCVRARACVSVCVCVHCTKGSPYDGMLLPSAWVFPLLARQWT